MTHQVVTAPPDATLADVGGLMRDRNVGSVVIADEGRPVAMITDRDVALAVAGDGVATDAAVDGHASRPLVCGDHGMDVEEAAALMVQNRIRRLPIVDGSELSGIVTLDDLAIKVGDLHLAQQMTAAVARAALPAFFFHERGG